jgi:hypothetical protein
MRPHRVRPTACLPAVLACAALFSGCGGEGNGNPVTSDTDTRIAQPANRMSHRNAAGSEEVPGAGDRFDLEDPLSNRSVATSPANLLARLEASWERGSMAELGALLADDYRFLFSSASDPELVVRYGNTWDTTMELQSLFHLRNGFTDAEGEFRPAATTVELSLTGIAIVPDPAHADSAGHYQLATAYVTGHLKFADGMQFEVAAPHAFHLVRGDAAVLGNGHASAHRWYLRKWEDRSTPAWFMLPPQVATIGAIKAAYLR